jgi:hypothetical protein
MLKKIISGGQTGADRAALDAAMRLGIPHGGWIPKGRIAEDGPLDTAYRLLEMPTDSYAERTEKNVLESDGTLIISHGAPTGGTEYTRKMVLKHGKQMLHIDPDLYGNLADAASLVKDWIAIHNIEIMNVAGPRASKDSRIYSVTLTILIHLVQGGL